MLPSGRRRPIPPRRWARPTSASWRRGEDLVVLDDDLTVDGVLRQGSWITAPVGGAVPVDSAAP